MARRLSLTAATGALIASAALSLPGAALAGPSQPSTSASCQGQVNGYYNRNNNDGGQLTSDYVHTFGGKAFSEAITLGARSHDCNVPGGV